MNKDFNLLPILADFSDLKMGDKIYSRRFGLGEVWRLYNKEVIVNFSHGNKRISPDELDISLVCKRTRKTGRNIMSGEVEGNKVSFGKMKQVMSYDIDENFVSIKNALYVLDLSRKKFNTLCDTHDIEIIQFGIKKDDLIKLSKVIIKNIEIK